MTIRSTRTAAPRLLGPEVSPAGLARPDTGAPDLWLLRVSEHRASLDAGLGVLDAGERARRTAFLRAADQDRYAAAHIALRRVLAAYLGTPPGAVALGREDCPVCDGPHGRPCAPGTGLHFSLSHSGDLVLMAFATTPVGVDVEKTPSSSVTDDLTPSLHPRERAEVTALPPAERPPAFVRCWARKEAYLKGTGHGLAGGTDTTYTGAGPAPAQLPGWTLTDIPVDPGYGAAVAVATA